MTTNAIAVEDTQVSNEPVNTPDAIVLDQFGRDESERSVVLSSHDAEAVDQECAAGKHQTYDDALAYVISRGLLEIKRVRDAAMKLAQAKLLASKQNNWKTIMAQNPALLIDPKIVATMLADLGIAPPKV